MSIAGNLESLQSTIAKTARNHGRNPSNIRLMAVSKTQPDEALNEALAAGQRLFGENRVQEAQLHWAARKAQYPDLELHLIGPLQTNKVAEALKLFDVIETLDREKLAKALAAEMDKQGRKIPCFIQVNTGEEPQKAGILPLELPCFYNFCVKDCGLDVTGLMCIPPEDEPPALHFALLKTHADRLDLKTLSMGMSGDFEKAIAVGAHIVRIGSGIFGARERLK